MDKLQDKSTVPEGTLYTETSTVQQGLHLLYVLQHHKQQVPGEWLIS